MIGDQPVLRPLPQRSFHITPSSTEPSTQPSTPPTPSQDSAEYPPFRSNVVNPSDRTRSILNLTSSTLLGIYSGENDGLRNGINTPMSTGALTPQTPYAGSFRLSQKRNDQRPPVIGAFEQSPRRKPQSLHQPTYLSIVGTVLPRTILLFVFGVAYGVVITHLHNDQQLAPIEVGVIEGNSWRYLAFWGIAGVTLGTLLPWVDVFWGYPSESREKIEISNQNEKPNRSTIDQDNDKGTLSVFGSNLEADWNPIVRSIGAFVGIAFAIVSIQASVVLLFRP